MPRSARLAIRFAGAALIAVLPLFGPDGTTAFVGIVAGILAFIVTVETLGKIGAIRVDLKSNVSGANRTVKSHQSKQKHYTRHESQLTEAEKGEEDLGIETELGDMEQITVYPAQKVRPGANRRLSLADDVHRAHTQLDLMRNVGRGLSFHPAVRPY